MAKTATSISVAELSQLTRSAVRQIELDVEHTFTGKGPIMGFILDPSVDADERLRVATDITKATASAARAQGLGEINPKPIVIARPGKIIAGFLTPELNIRVR